jgi:N4-gp56 family major capsid protein
MQQYSTAQSRNLILAERTMLKHAEPVKVISGFGVQKELPTNKTDTIVYRRPLPIDADSRATSVNVNTSDYLLQEGATPTARTIQYEDVSVQVQNYGVLMKLSSKTELLHEDAIPADMQMLVGEHMGVIEELISYGVVRGGTNVVYANGSSRAQVTGVLSLAKLRAIKRTLENSIAKLVTSRLAPGPNYDTSAVSPSYLVFIHTDLEADARNIPGFTTIDKYGSFKPVHEREIGNVENFRFITSPYFRPWLLAGGTAAAGVTMANGAPSTGANASDVYPVTVIAQDAWGQVAVKGQGSIDVTYLPAKQKSHANPMGLFGYVGASFWKNAIRLNERWLVRYEVAASAL